MDFGIFAPFASQKAQKVQKTDSSTENVRIDLNIGHCFVIRPLACKTAKIAVFFQHIDCFVEVLSVLEQGASAKVVQVVLPYFSMSL